MCGRAPILDPVVTVRAHYFLLSDCGAFRNRKHVFRSELGHYHWIVDVEQEVNHLI